MRLDAMIDTGDPRWTLTQVIGPLTASKDDCGCLIGCRRQVVTTQRVAHVVSCEQLVDRKIALHLCKRVRLGVGAVPSHDLSEIAFGGLTGIDERTCLQCGQCPGVGTQRSEVIGIEFNREQRRWIGVGVLANADGHCDVNVALKKSNVGLVHRPRAVHLDMRLVDCRNHAVGVGVLHK